MNLCPHQLQKHYVCALNSCSNHVCFSCSCDIPKRIVFICEYEYPLAHIFWRSNTIQLKKKAEIAENLKLKWIRCSKSKSSSQLPFAQ